MALTYFHELPPALLSQFLQSHSIVDSERRTTLRLNFSGLTVPISIDKPTLGYQAEELEDYRRKLTRLITIPEDNHSEEFVIDYVEDRDVYLIFYSHTREVRLRRGPVESELTFSGSLYDIILKWISDTVEKFPR